MTRPLISLCTFFFLLNLHGQDEPEYRGRFFLAPDLGLMIGTTTRIEVAPMSGYYLTNRITLAAGARYEYHSLSSRYYGLDAYKTSIYGPRFQAKLYAIRNIDNILPLRLNMAVFLQAEQEFLSLEKRYFEFPGTDEDGRFWQPFTMAGFGISQQAGEIVHLNIAILWDMDHRFNSPYTNPIFRVGFKIVFRKKDIQ